MGPRIQLERPKSNKERRQTRNSTPTGNFVRDSRIDKSIFRHLQCIFNLTILMFVVDER